MSTTTIAISLSAIPRDLKDHRQWMTWRFERCQGKRVKVPFAINGEYARVNDPSTWTSFDDMSHGFWHHVLLVPFDVQFKDANRDEEMEDKLLTELPGILNWALEGCRKWQVGGLKRPDAVNVATNDYREHADPLAGVLEDECVQEPVVLRDNLSKK